MKRNRKKLKKTHNSREYLVYLLCLDDPYDESLSDKQCSRRGIPCPNKRSKYRRKNDMKSWKNYRKHQFR